MGISAIIALNGWIANNLRGQWATIMGIIIVVGINYIQGVHNHMPLDPQQMVFMLIKEVAVLFGFTALPPAKLRSYEHDPIIMEAKEKP